MKSFLELGAIALLLFLKSAILSPPVGGTELPLKVQRTFKLVSGLQMERVPRTSSHFYSQFVPLVYQFTIPRWDKSDTNIHGSQNCNGTTYSKFFTTCPVLYYVSEMHDRFSEYLVNNQPLVANLDEIGAKPETTLIPFDCELVEPHFDDIYVDRVTLEEYLSRLKACSPLGAQEFIQGISNYVYNVSSIYFNMRKNFYSEFWLKIDLVDGRVDAAIWSNAINVFNSLVFENYLMEASRWKMAVTDCEAGRIPSTVLPPSLISDTLNDMLESMSTQNLLPTISANTIGNYYKSSITDCTFTNDTFLVRVLVPVIPNTKKFLLLKVSSVPFYYGETGSEFQCQIDEAALPSPGMNTDNYVLVDLVKNVAYESDCVPGKFCHIPTPLHPRKVSPCATAGFNWERFKSNDSLRLDLIKNCPISCSPVNKFQKNQVSQIAPGEFLVFSGEGQKSDSVIVNCSVSNSLSPSTTGADYLLHSQKSSTYGSRLFDVNCNCLMSFQSESYKPKGCNSILNVHPTKQDVVQISDLAPVHWYNVDNKGKAFKDLWNVPEDLFRNPSKALIKRALEVGPGAVKIIKMEGDPTPQSASPLVVSTLIIICLGLAVAVFALGWRLHRLIIQLEGIGFNVREQGSYSVHQGSNGSGQHVSYRNMRSLIDNDSLAVNDDDRQY